MPWDDLWTWVFGQGPAAVIILFLAGVIGILFKLLIASYQARLDDQKATLPVLQSASTAILAVTTEMASRTNMASSMGEAIRGLREAQQTIAERVEKINDFLRENRGGRE